MAKIDHTKFRNAGTKPVTVGNNRKVYRPRPGALNCDLHGHTVVQIVDGMVTLDTCGYSTTTTRAAMQDFLDAALPGIWTVSFARGKLTVGMPDGRTMSTDGSTLTFPVAR